MHLDIGRCEFRARLQEGQQRRRGQAEEAAAKGEIFCHLPDEIEAARPLVVGDAGGDDPPLDAGVDVVAKVLADGRQIVGDLDPVAAQQLGPTDAGEL